MAIEFDHSNQSIMATAVDPLIDGYLSISAPGGGNIVLDGPMVCTNTVYIGGIQYPFVDANDSSNLGKFLSVRQMGEDTPDPEIALVDITWDEVQGKPELAPVALSGSYNDLTDLPAGGDGGLGEVSLEAYSPLASADVLAYEVGVGWINRSLDTLIEFPEPPEVSLDSLAGVGIGSPVPLSDGDVLTYEPSLGWYNRPLADMLPPPSGGGASVLDDLNDVSIGVYLPLQGSDILTYEEGSGWFNRPLADLLPPPVEPTTPEVAVADLSDVVLNDPFPLVSGDSLVFQEGMGWINRPLQSILGYGSDGQILTIVNGNPNWADAPSGGGGGGGISADEAILYSILFG